MLGFNAAQMEAHFFNTPMLESRLQNVPIVGRLIRAEMLPEGTRLTLFAAMASLPSANTLCLAPHLMPLPRLIRLTTAQNILTLPAAGTMVRVYGGVSPFNEPQSPDSYDFRRHFYFLGIGATGQAISNVIPLHSPIDTSIGSSFDNSIESSSDNFNKNSFKNSLNYTSTPPQLNLFNTYLKKYCDNSLPSIEGQIDPNTNRINQSTNMPAEQHQALPFTLNLNLWFEKARTILTRHVLKMNSDESAAMTIALLTGEQTGISKTVMTDMRNSGLVHLLSISGVHVAMMGLLIYIPLRALLALIPFAALYWPVKKIAALLSIFIIGMYVLLVGPEAPTLRSMLMISILMFAIINDRRIANLRLLMLSALAVMLIFPNSITGPSFQMSFAAVLAMIASAQFFKEKKLSGHFSASLSHMPSHISSITTAHVPTNAFPKPKTKQNLNHKNSISYAISSFMQILADYSVISKLIHASKTLIITSLIVTAAVSPIALYHFQSFSIYGTIANLLAIPLTSFWIMPNLLLIYLTAPIGWDAPFIWGANTGTAGLIYIAKIIGNWPFAIIKLPAMPNYAFAIFISGFLWLCLKSGKYRSLGFLLVFIALLYPLYIKKPDIYISENGQDWLARINDETFVTDSEFENSFTINNWLARNGGGKAISTHQQNSTPSTTLPFDLHCNTKACLYSRTIGSAHTADGKVKIYKIGFIKKISAAPEICRIADIVISPLNLSSCSAAQVFDKARLQQTGAITIRFTPDKAVISQTWEKMQKRPWSAHDDLTEN